MDEFQIIDELLKPLAANMPAALGLTDDAAVVTPPAGCDLVMTKDAVVAGVHFMGDDPPDLIARKLLRVNLSDLCAMGARAYGYLLAAAWPPDINEDWIRKFVAGLASDQDEFNIGLLGGDTVSTSGPLTLTLTAIGTVLFGQALKRSGAEPGDRLMVSGTIGDAWIGLQVLKGEIDLNDAEWAIEAYRLPNPPVEFGASLAGLADAGIDISDGLVADLRHLLETSEVGAALSRAAVPLSQQAQELIEKGVIGIDDLMRGGDDYQLLLAVPAQNLNAVSALAKRHDITLCDIGEVTEKPGLVIDGEAFDASKSGAGGYRHDI